MAIVSGPLPSDKKQGEKAAGIAAPQDDVETAADEPIGGNEELDTSAEHTETQGDGETETSEVAERKPRQSQEDNARFADRRRKQELDALRQEKRQRDEWVKANFGASHGITTWEQYAQAVEAENKRKVDDGLREKGLDPELIRQALRSDPEFQQIKRENDEFKRERTSQTLLSQFTELTQEFPHIKEVSDVDDATWQKFNASNGALTLTEAYVAAHRKELKDTLRSEGEKQARSKIGSKDHLGTEKSGSGGFEPDVTIPPERIKSWRQMFPGITLAQIKQKERKYQK
jgi:cell fate (sporulation/competence/biofilm development) regulator YlbF (YheA/YmcA/DUF963 family)